MTAARFLDIHALHPSTAANLNSDESGEPKTLELGGAIRTMISSQAWKRPIRLAVEEELDEHAARTRMVPPTVTDALRAEGWTEDLASFAAAQIAASAKTGGLKTNPQEDHRTQAMFFLPADTARHLTQLCRTHRTTLEEGLAKQTATKKPAPALLPTDEITAQLTRRTASISLFGRMLTEIHDGHIQAAVQMAPAFTVHRSEPQPDFFTAVDDWPRPGEAGSAHLNTAYRSTGHFYRFATVNTTTLLANLNGDTTTARTLIDLFTQAFIMTMPRGGQTSAAAHTVPDLVHYVVRDRRPVSYGAAFEQPVRSHGQGYVLPARQALTTYATTIDRLIGTRHRITHGHATTAGTPIGELGTHHTGFDDLAATCARTALPDTPSQAAA
ncbi:type I-E CRISPR-associated protein Cas7/Cse4/CasC [Streptomyces yatensis]|uniref:Type I-E CRISPR-associated protein Cas7/Cse4/CasC n=1 Tax=Streptomyces yatensis TaxID=155177 RepID=A0ABN2JMW6_9ACTN|nr:type I-E CRISPR-associated protein Cas7/Cse4/CasC [Streptomyces yatensis]